MKINFTSRKSFSRAIAKLDAIRDHQMIVRMMSREFGYEAEITFDIGFMRSLGALKISALLEKTQQLHKQSVKRYEDTFIIISEMTLNGYDSEVGRAALQKMNAIHQRFQIQNEDYLFILSIYAFELIDWLEKNAWRKITVKEKMAWFYFWVQIGQRMGMQDIPYTEAAFRQFVSEYEDSQVQYAPRNHELAKAYMAVVRGRIYFLKYTLQSLVLYGLSERYRVALGLKPMGVWRKTLAIGSIWLRKISQNLVPFIILSDLRRRYKSYPKGYDVKNLGPSAPMIH